MHAKNKILIIAGTLTSIPVIAVTIIGTIAVWPMLTAIGIAIAGFIYVCILCASIGVISFTIHRIGVWHLNEIHRRNTVNLIVSGDVVVYRDANNGLIHLSAEHERAKAMGMALLADRASSIVGDNVDMDISGNDCTIIELYQKGISENTIAKCVKIPWDIVHKVIEQKG